MDTLLIIAKSLPLIFITILLELRLLNRTIKRKFPLPLTFIILLLGRLAASFINYRMHIANHQFVQTFYYGIISLGLYALLFKGNLVKKIFFVALVTCAAPILHFIFLPFVHFYFIGHSNQLTMWLQIIEIASLVLCGLCFEYIGKRFQNLRMQLPRGYTAYLSAFIAFVYVAVFISYDYLLILYQGKFPLSFAFISSFFAISGAAISGITIFALDKQVNRSLQQQLSALQTANFTAREAEWRLLFRFKHDIKNHLICLTHLLENAQNEEASAYIQQLTNTVQNFVTPVQTGNTYADAILSSKYTEAVRCNINVTIKMAIPADGYISPIDLCCILSNAMDNAIAACMRLAPDKRWINARAFVSQKQLIISIKNSMPCDTMVANGAVFPKADIPNRGFGLENIKIITEKYGGVLDISANDAFTFCVLIPENLL